MLKVLCWIKNNIWKALSAFFGGIAVIFGLGFLIRGKVINSVRNESAILELKKNISSWKIRSDELRKNVEIDDLRLIEIEKEKEHLKNEIERARDVFGFTNEEIVEAFRELGY